MPDSIPLNLPPVYSVENLLAKLAFKTQGDIYRRLDAIIRVQGKVGKVKTYGKVTFFDLSGNDGNLSVKTASTNSIQTGEHIVVEGVPIMKPSKFHTGLAVEIDGHPIANWEPRHVEKPVIDLNKNAFHKLEDYVTTYGYNEMLLLGSETGIQDVLSNIHADLARCLRSKTTTVSNKEILTKDIKMAIDDEYTAVLIARGGNDQSLTLWDEPEFVQVLIASPLNIYLALGHSHRITLACQFADESFSTPTALGTALNRLFERQVYLTQLEKRTKDIEEKNRHLEKELFALKKVNEHSAQEQKQLLNEIRQKDNMIQGFRKPYIERTMVVILVVVIFVLLML